MVLGERVGGVEGDAEVWVEAEERGGAQGVEEPCGEQEGCAWGGAGEGKADVKFGEVLGEEQR